ncbi:MAG TPA: hypothetical protein VFA21_21360 [Pyrinomonadaceae bacterium]|nr:hypothetical protein [Pyrinomonadaceae bacterium]
MKKILSLLLSFIVGFLGMISLGASAARAQTAASVSLSKLREQYEQLLAVERDPNTTPEVRERNHAFLEARRAQLAAALRKRMDALRAYRANLATTLTDEEKSAVEVSIQQLADELQTLQPPAAAPAQNARPSRRPLRTTQPKPPIQQASFDDAEKSGDSAAERSAEPSPAPRRASNAVAIEITSPDADKTVHVGEIEMEVNVNDQDVDDIMVAVYTPASAKPLSARTIELKRSDKGTKSFVISLSKGDNRIEVSDLNRPDVKAERNITFAVPNAPAIGGVALSDAPTPSSRDRLTSTAEAEPLRSPGAATICGQLTPASLNQTIGLLKGAPGFETRGAPLSTPLHPAVTSMYDDDCQSNSRKTLTTGAPPVNGSQKEAVVTLLKALLNDLGASPAYNLSVVGPQFGIATATNPNVKLPSEFRTLSKATIRKQILLLEQYFGNVAVQITGSDGKPVATGFTDKDGNYSIVIPDTTKCPCTISSEADNFQTKREFVPADGGTQRVNLEVDDKPVSLLARAVVGYEQAGVSSATREQNYFFDFFIRNTVPFAQKIHPDFGERISAWGDIRFQSVPQPGNTALGTFISNFSQQAANVQVKDVARVFDFLGGIEVRLSGNNALLPSFDRQTKQKFTLSFIAAGGTITPLNSQETLATFRVFPDAPGLPPEARGKDFVSFIAADRTHFFRQYFVGLRVQTFFFNKYNIPMQRFPAQLDIAVGQSEFITGGRLHGAVIRVEGYYPLPYEGLKFINLFGTAELRPGRDRAGLPLVLQAAPADTVIPASNVVLILAPQPNRDYYRAGIGIDFISFVDALKKLTSSTNK